MSNFPFKDGDFFFEGTLGILLFSRTEIFSCRGTLGVLICLASAKRRNRGESEARFVAGTKRRRALARENRSCRAAGNRTRASRPPASRTTTIRQPVFLFIANAPHVFLEGKTWPSGPERTPKNAWRVRLLSMQRLDTARTDQFSYALNLGPLEVGIFPRPIYRIVVAAEQFSGTAHL